MQHRLTEWTTCKEGAVAPLLAMSLFALVAAGGIAFDYARMASMDTELQNAADQAALAAASQLDNQAGACERASAAAVGMIANFTRMANDGDAGGRAIGITGEPACDAIGSIRFWQDKAKTLAATDDSNAMFVEVTVDGREAFFAFTPIVGRPSSGSIVATAFAGLDQAVCETPTIMICNPQETGSNIDFDVGPMIGVGLRLVSVGGGNGSWAPGNLGYLSNGGGSNGATGLREMLGWDSPPGECVAATDVDTKPGASVSVTGALNTRFDIYDSNPDCPSGGACPASINAAKDVRRTASASGGNACRLHSQGWQLPANHYGSGAIPLSPSVPLPAAVIPSAMGHPRDMCHSVDPSVPGACSGPIGDGNWDRDAYFRTNYRRGNGTRWTAANWQANTGLPANATRYAVYNWEIANRGATIDGVTILGTQPAGATGTTLVGHGTPVCSPSKGFGPGTVPTVSTQDRRRVVIAVVNCLAEGVNGSSTDVPVLDWLDVFLVEPSLNRPRTHSGEVYAEVIKRTTNSTREGGVQLVKRSAPYLIE